MNLSELDTTHHYLATVQESDRITPEETDEVRHIVLRVPDATFSYLEGQSVGVLVPGPHPFGNPDHLRLYSLASARSGEGGTFADVSLCVRRCFYLDEISGERHPGIASNFLCDAKPGDAVTLTGPYGRSFTIPRDTTCNLLLIGMGTGMAPFRAFLKRIYDEDKTWQGKVRLFYGARTGMDLLYQNDQKNDLAQYYQEENFKAFEALSARPHVDDSPALDRTLQDNATEIWDLLRDPKTHVYLAGLSKVADATERALSEIAGSPEAWHNQREELLQEHRWSQILYD